MPEPMPLVSLVATRAAAIPDAVAVESGDERLTYAALLDRIDRLAAGLRAAGVRRGDVVAVAMPRGVALIPALLGVHRAGAAYLPLDPDHPVERLAGLLADSGTSVLVTAGDGTPVPAATVVDVDDLPPAPASPPEPPAIDDPAYVIYTSGSTGRPKGVMVTHRSLTTFLQSMRERPGLAAGTVLPAVTTVSFDIAALELFLPLLVDGRVVVGDREDARDPERLSALLARVGARVLQATPTTWRLLLDAGWQPPAGFTALCGGEKLPADLARRLGAAGVLLWDLYGPTETTIWSSVASVVDGRVTDFTPVAGTTLHVLDDRLAPVAPGHAGELCIGGAGVAVGYLGRTRLTADRFVPDPAGDAPGARLYRTGDIARQHPDGVVEILGRADDQVKIRGHRVEPAEVEDALVRHGGVRAAVVRAVAGPAGDPLLVGYLQPADPADPPSAAEMHRHCAAVLPSYLIPARFVVLDVFPTTPNGKLDRAALPDPPADAPAGHDAPRTGLERTIAAVLGEAIGRTTVGVHDDFFLLGGHSLLAVRAVGRLRSVLGVDLPVAALFRTRTVAGLAEVVAGAAPAAAAIPASAGSGPAPLSFAQHRMWLLHQMDPAGLAYLEPFAVPLPGPFHAGRLEAALTGMFTRHDILRTRYAAGPAGEPVQIVEPAAPVRLEPVDGEPADVLARELATPFDLGAGPPVRLRLVRDRRGRHTVVLVAHHIAVDDRSLEILAADLTAAYGGGTAPVPAVSYRDYAVWQRERMSGPLAEEHLAFWRRRLSGLEPTELLTDRPRRAAGESRGGTVRFGVDASVAGRLTALGAASATTPFVTLLTAFLVLVARHAGRTDVAVGVPVSGRDRTELDGVAGLFVNTMVIRADLTGHRSFTTSLAAVRDEVLAAYPHAEVPFDLVVQDLAPARDLSRNPLFTLLFTVHDAGPPDPAAIPDLPAAKFDLGCHLTPRPDGGYDGRIEYSAALFDRSTVTAVAGRFAHLLTAVAEAPEADLDELAAAPAPVRPAPVAVPAATVADLVAEQAARTDAVAVTGPLGALTYPELDRQVNQLAHALREQGAGPDRFVVVRMPRSPGLVVALLAVVRSGAAYIPVDPGHPVERLHQAIADSGATLVVTPADAAGDLPAGVTPLCPDDPAEAARLRRRPATPPAVTPDPDDLAYVVYTSGSTGRPKGAMVTHRGLTNYTRWAVEHLRPGDGAGSPLHTSLAYDLALTALYPSLAAGAPVDLVPEDGAGVEALAGALTGRAGRRPYAVVKLTPTHLDLLARTLPEDMPAAPARRLVVGGEELRGEQLAGWTAAAPDTLVVNSYGPSETAVACCVHSVRAGDLRPGPVPIGRPLPGAEVHLLDGALRPVPDGAPGEIHVGGAGVGRGYLGDPRLTADRFVPDPHSGRPGSRLYRTGDLARRGADGALTFLGRTDDQVKIRGYRVEPGEVESALVTHPAVRAAAVVVDRRDPGNPRLAAHVVGAAGPVPAADLRAHLLDRLPAHQVPTLWGSLPALPMLGNGKVDRAALPALSPAAGGGPGDRPMTPAERTIAEVWAEVLGAGGVGPDENFFDLGGQSLLATRAAVRLGERFGVPVSVRDLLTAPTVARLAGVVAGRLRAQFESQFGAAATAAAEPEASAPAAPLTATPIPRVSRTGPLPLSPAQRRLWFLDQLDPGSTAYVVVTALRIRGALDRPALARSLQRLVARHEILRTRYLPGPGPDDDPVQVVDEPPAAFPLTVAGTDPAAVLAAEVATPFDLASGPALRARLVAAGPGEHLLTLAMHHITTDGWSTGVLGAEIAAGYRDEDRGPLPVQYADFAAWQADRLSGPLLDGLLGYWRDRLAGSEPAELPTDRPRPPVRDERGAVLRFTVPAELTARLDRQGREAGATPFMVLLTGFFMLVSRWTGRTDLALGAPVSGRHHADLDDLIGFFVNTVVLRADLSGDPSFRTLLARVRDTATAAYLHDELPFDRLVEDLAPQRDLSGGPLVRLLFAVRDPAGHRFELPGLTVTEEAVPGRTAKFDLTCELTRLPGGGLSGEIEYATALFDEATITRLAGHYTRLLACAAEHPDAPLHNLRMLGDDELSAVTGGGDGPVRSWDDDGLPELIARRAAADPGGIAVESGSGVLTYRDLDAAANRLAHHLAASGIGRDDVVGICLPRRPSLVVSVLAVLRAGAAFLPLDPRHPAQRSAFMLRDAGAKLLIADAGAPAEIASCPVLDPAADAARLDDRPGDTAPAPSDPDALAYVIFTSGSTGRPKGVGVPHRGIRNRILWAVRQFGLGPGDRMLQKTSVTFDASVWELLGPLVWGGTVVLPPDGTERDPALMAAELSARGITVLQGVPSVLRLLADEPDLARCASLRLIFSAGEALPGELAGTLAARSGAQVVNTYGPTECSIDVTSWSYDRGGSAVPIGRPIDNTRAVVFLPGGVPAPIGVPGELHVAGAGLARGYLGRPRLTADRFVPDPYGPPGSRAYRTGDVVRRTPAGVLEFRGRADDQVKIRGVRVEPGEVESVLAGHEAVAAAAVVARPGPDGSPRLVAYVVAAGDPPGTGELRAHLLTRLPEPQVPSVFVPLDRLPTTPSGKIDRAALPDPAGPGGADRVEPRTPTELLVADVMADVLGLEAVGAADDFFDLGGHSLLAVRIAGRLRAALGVAVTVRTVFEARTVAGLAGHADRMSAAPDAASGPMAPGRPGVPLPLSYAQQRMWFLSELHPGSPEYHVTWAHRLTGELDEAALAAAVGDLAARHAVLRTRYVTGGDGEPAQVIDPPAPVRLAHVDLSAGGDAGQRLPSALRALADVPFDLSAGPPVRPCLIRLGAGDHVLAVVLHHIGIDAWSEDVLARDLSVAYGARLAGKAPDLGPAPARYADFAAWQRSHLTGAVLEAELRHWRARLAALTPLDLPADRRRPAVRDGLGATVGFRIPAGTAQPWIALGRAHGATAFMTFLGVFAALLHRYTGTTDLAVGTPVAGRGRPELDDVVGFFVNTVVLRLDLAGDPTPAALVRRVRDVALDCFGHDDVPFDALVEDLSPERDLSRSPLVDVVFEVRESPGRLPELPGLGVRRVSVPRTTAKFDLSLTLTAEPDGGYRGELEYATALFDEATVRRLAGNLGVLTAAMTAHPDRPVGRLPLLPAAERHRLLHEWNEAPAPAARECLHEAFAARVARCPDAPAVIGAHERLSYAELDRRATALAHRLRAAGIDREMPVAVFLERSPAVLVVLLAILRAGGAFVALDPAQPAGRRSAILDDLRPAAVVTDRRWASALGRVPAPVLVHDDGRTAPAEGVLPRPDPDSAAYMIYTSGSTGRPKAVVIPHAALTHHCRAIAEVYDIRAGDRGVLMAALTFDLAMEQMVVPLVAGAAVVVCEERFWTPDELPDRFAEHGVTNVLLPPAYYREMMDGVRHGDPRLTTLRMMGVGADVVTADDARRWWRSGLPGRFVNGYGPTEATIASVTYAVPESEATDAAPGTTAPIGRPVPGTRAYVLDAHGELQPVGVPGELCIGGARVSRGYLRQPRLTADRFVPDPYGGPGERLYRTGDRARHRADGVIEFLGRVDTQVKIRGFRVELGEIEAVLGAHRDVRAAAVTAVDGPGGPRLAGYVAFEDDRDCTVAELREHLRRRLPEYMVPATLTVLERLPMSASGKVDRRALPAPPAEPESTGEEPRTEVEKAIAGIWSEVLGVSRIGAHDEFFDIGGHSLLATRVLVRLRDLFGLDVPLRLLFEATTVGALALALERLAEHEATATAPAGARPSP